METPSGKQNMTIINESGLYALIFGSKLESAKKLWDNKTLPPSIKDSIKIKNRSDNYLRYKNQIFESHGQVI